jgi:hypothetical protein
MASKAKADTVAGAREAMENALRGTLQVPKHITLKSEHMPFWHGIIKSRALSDWEEVDLVVAAQLARCQYEIEVATEQLDGEDTVLFNARGTQIMNPRLNVLEQLARREMALMRSLRLAGRAGGDPRPEANRAKAQKKAAAGLQEADDDDDDLLAK